MWVIWLKKLPHEEHKERNKGFSPLKTNVTWGHKYDNNGEKHIKNCKDTKVKKLKYIMELAFFKARNERKYFKF